MQKAIKPFDPTAEAKSNYAAYLIAERSKKVRVKAILNLSLSFILY